MLTPRWQRALAAISLSIVNVVVVLPAVVAVLLLWALVLTVAGVRSLDSAGALRRGPFGASFLLAIVVVGFGATASLGTSVLHAARRKPSPTIPMERRRPGRWLLRHPWTSTGMLLLATDVTIVPLDLSGAVDVDSVPVGAALVGTGLWLVGTFGYALVKGWALVLRLLWAGVRRSPFFAGLVVLGSLAVSLGGLLLGASFSNQAAAIAPSKPRDGVAACSSPTDCLRLGLESAARPKPSLHAAPSPPFAQSPAPTWVPPPPAPSAPVEPPAAFEECIRALYDNSRGQSLREWGVVYARARSLDQDAAEDVVHSTMLAVCTVADRLRELRPYFVKSLQNAVIRERRTWRRWCPMVPDPRVAPPGCVTRSVEDEALRKELEDATGAALCDLDVEDRWVIVARLWENMSYDEIARRWNITPENARQRYSRALASLRVRFSLRCE